MGDLDYREMNDVLLERAYELIETERADPKILTDLKGYEVMFKKKKPLESGIRFSHRSTQLYPEQSENKDRVVDLIFSGVLDGEREPAFGYQTDANGGHLIIRLTVDELQVLITKGLSQLTRENIWATEQLVGELNKTFQHQLSEAHRCEDAAEERAEQWEG
tara:strand:- start:532 stop:1017 length:486 start_codon:yes stop_codon:yes gene_type:complete